MNTDQGQNTLPGLKEKLKVADPEMTIYMQIAESETKFMLTMPSISVSSDNIEESTFVKAQNAKYKELKAIIPNNDNYVSKGIQTYVDPKKHKEVLTFGNKMVHAEVNTTSWDIYDAFAVNEEEVAQVNDE